MCWWISDSSIYRIGEPRLYAWKSACACRYRCPARTMIQLQIQSLDERNHSSRDATTKHAIPPAGSRAPHSVAYSEVLPDVEAAAADGRRLHTHRTSRGYRGAPKVRSASQADAEIASRLRSTNKYPTVRARTSRYKNSFIPYACASNYQWQWHFHPCVFPIFIVWMFLCYYNPASWLP